MGATVFNPIRKLISGTSVATLATATGVTVQFDSSLASKRIVVRGLNVKHVAGSAATFQPYLTELLGAAREDIESAYSTAAATAVATQVRDVLDRIFTLDASARLYLYPSTVGASADNQVKYKVWYEECDPRYS